MGGYINNWCVDVWWPIFNRHYIRMKTKGRLGEGEAPPFHWSEDEREVGAGRRTRAPSEQKTRKKTHPVLLICCLWFVFFGFVCSINVVATSGVEDVVGDGVKDVMVCCCWLRTCWCACMNNLLSTISCCYCSGVVVVTFMILPFLLDQRRLYVYFDDSVAWFDMDLLLEVSYFVWYVACCSHSGLCLCCMETLLLQWLGVCRLAAGSRCHCSFCRCYSLLVVAIVIIPPGMSLLLDLIHVCLFICLLLALLCYGYKSSSSSLCCISYSVVGCCSCTLADCC